MSDLHGADGAGRGPAGVDHARAPGESRGAAGVARGHRRSPRRDAGCRAHTRGVALFSSSKAGLWEAAELPRPTADLATVADQPYVLRLETLIETYESFCTVIVDRERARIFLATMGRIQEERDLFDEV